VYGEGVVTWVGGEISPLDLPLDLPLNLPLDLRADLWRCASVRASVCACRLIRFESIAGAASAVVSSGMGPAGHDSSMFTSSSLTPPPTDAG